MSENARKKPTRDPYLALASKAATHRKRADELRAMIARLQTQLAKRQRELSTQEKKFDAVQRELLGSAPEPEATDGEA